MCEDGYNGCQTGKSHTVQLESLFLALSASLWPPRDLQASPQSVDQQHIKGLQGAKTFLKVAFLAQVAYQLINIFNITPSVGDWMMLPLPLS